MSLGVIEAPNNPQWQDLGQVVTTEDGSLSLRHPEHGECYHSDAGAAAEALSLYLLGSGIADRFATGVAATAVLDVGLGLGYNALATLHAWMTAAQPGDLTLLSLEINPQLVAALASGQAPWQANWDERALQCVRALHEEPGGAAWRGVIAHPSGASAHWVIRIGDAETVELADSGARPFDYVWQDPFSPDKNPALWTSAWFAKVRAVAGERCVLMTYSVARRVRDALSASGWLPERIPTPLGRKRHWLMARLGGAAPIA
jgi:tRNA U34 5-methylaminomethyl-2-thiouridine-forming methyltransferase MnmC